MSHYAQAPSADEIAGSVISKLIGYAIVLFFIWLAARFVFMLGMDEGKTRCMAGDCILKFPSTEQVKGRQL